MLCPTWELYWSRICSSCSEGAVVKVSGVELSLILNVIFIGCCDILGASVLIFYLFDSELQTNFTSAQSTLESSVKIHTISRL